MSVTEIDLNGRAVTRAETAEEAASRARVHAELQRREQLALLQEAAARKRLARDPVEQARAAIEADILADKTVDLENDPRWPR